MMTSDVLFSGLSIIGLLLLSAFFSGSETALTAASRARIRRMAADGDARAPVVERLIDNRERLIGGILLGNNLVNILASALATGLFLRLVGEAGVYYATLVMTALVLIFAEVLPKTYAITRPDRMALAVAKPIRLVTGLFSPVVILVQRIVRITLRGFGVNVSESDSFLTSHEEIRGHIELHASEGGIVKEHRDMLGGILDLDDVFVEDIMVHRKNVEMIDLDEPAADIIAQIIATPHTRLPIYREDSENILGVIHAKDVLRAMLQPGAKAETLDLVQIANEPWFVPETTSLREQMNAFLARKQHFALVVDEYGALMGLITLEDILEEIVGEIADEYDIFQTEGIEVHDDGSVTVEGTVSIRDLNRRMDWTLPDEDASTIAGLVLNEARIIPVKGQSFSFFGHRFEILKRQRHQLTLIRITPEAD
ncbi:MAG: HlyC/CorC family transporter [Sphingomonadales bacterium]